MVEEDIPVLARTFRQREEDRLGEKATRRLHEEEMAEIETERAEAHIKRQQEVLESTKFYNEDDWLNIRAQVEANASLSKTLLGSVLEEPPTKKPKSLKAPTPSMSAIPISPAVTSPPSSRTRRKSLARKHMHKPKSKIPTLDLDAPAQTFLKVIVDEDSNDEDSIDEVWYAVVGWEILSTPLDVSYPLSLELIKKMLLHKLEIDSDFMGNDLTIAEQLIQFIKEQIVAAHASSV
nr:hypothetical protein [Tanacetum cinerariifolium]